MSTKYNALRYVTTRTQTAFSLIELMIVVAIIGILAAIAIPAYNDYTIRSKITEVVNAASAAKTSVSEFYVTKGIMPSSASQGGVGSPATDYVASVGYARDGTNTSIGRITVTTDDTDIGLGAAKTIIFEGTGSATGVTWICTGGDLDAKYRPSQCRA